MYPLRKLAQNEQEKLEAKGYALFSADFFESALLDFLYELGSFQHQYRALNRKELMLCYARGFRSLLAVGIALNAKDDINQSQIPDEDRPVNKLCLDLYEQAVTLRYTLKDHGYYSLFATYLQLGNILNINLEDINYVFENEE